MAVAVPPVETDPALQVPPARSRTRHPIAAFVFRRIATGLLTLVAASFLIFGAVQVLPGDVATIVLGKGATPEALAEVRAELGLDRPFVVRYVDFLGGAVTGDFGQSSAALAQGNDLPVWDSIKTPLSNSLTLAGLTLLILIPLSMLLGAVAATRVGRGSDHFISTSSLIFSAMPEFLIGTLFVALFFTQLDWLPPISQIQPGETPFTNVKGLVLPVATLLAVSLAFTTRLVRAAMIDVLRQDYVGMARLNGFGERTVMVRYGLRNSLAPSIQAIALTSQYLIGGIIVTESVFAYPGVGNQLVQAVGVRDVTTIAGITFVLAAIYIVINIIADLLVVLLVPRLRTSA